VAGSAADESFLAFSIACTDILFVPVLIVELYAVKRRCMCLFPQVNMWQGAQQMSGVAQGAAAAALKV
jgi:hypothetical protein